MAAWRRRSSKWANSWRELQAPPSDRVMAPFACEPKSETVGIHGAMAIDALRRDFERRGAARSVALLAGEREMGANQRIMRLFRVVEAPLPPGDRVVASLAARRRSQGALMIVLMAVDARHRKLERSRVGRRMALLAHRRGVGAGERKPGLARVIEPPALPRRRIMAFAALRGRP